MPLIAFENVVKKFNGVTVLDGLSFSVEPGEIFCIVGRSGTGKSVALKHIVRLLSPTSGRVLFEGKDVSASCGKELSHIRSRIGYLFQSGALLAWMTVWDNVALPLRETTALSEDEIAQRTAEALAAVGLTNAAEKYPSEISGGMQKRAGLARAIVRKSDVILYDEPTSGLDPVTAATINELIVKLNRTRSITSVVVTHDIGAALALANHIMLLDKGRCVVCATPEEFKRSSQPEARAFLAAANREWL